MTKTLPGVSAEPFSMAALATIESTARGCGVFSSRHNGPPFPAVRIVIDDAVYFLWPGPGTGTWLAAPSSCSGDFPEDDPEFTLSLCCGGNENTVPTRAWAQFLLGDTLGCTGAGRVSAGREVADERSSSTDR